jgi:hypothetical protein
VWFESTETNTKRSDKQYVHASFTPPAHESNTAMVNKGTRLVEANVHGETDAHGQTELLVCNQCNEQ